MTTPTSNYTSNTSSPSLRSLVPRAGWRARATSAALAAALVLGASPAAAVAPATGTWSGIGLNLEGPLAISSGTVPAGVRPLADGTWLVYGDFTNLGGDVAADYIAVYNPATEAITHLGSFGGNGAFNAQVMDVAVVNGIIYAGGSFTSVYGVAGFDFLAAWNGTSWTPRGSMDAAVRGLATANGRLFAAGDFSAPDGDSAARGIASWNGVGWHGLGDFGSPTPPLNGPASDVVLGPGNQLYVSGSFLDAGGNVDADRVARLDLTNGTWHPVGTATSGFFGSSTVNAIAVSGTRVLLGGDFTNAGGDALADHVIEWTGTAFRHLGASVTGVDGALDGTVFGVAYYGTNALVAGQFSSAAGVANTGLVAAFNGTTWMPMGVPGVVLGAPSFPFGGGIAVVGRTAVLTGRFTNVGAVEAADGIAQFGLPAPPSAPRSPAGTSGLRRVTLTWAAPATTNGAPVTDFIVQFRLKGTTTWKTFNDGVRTTRSATVTGLTSGRTFEFRVRAVNAWGQGAFSATLAKVAG